MSLVEFTRALDTDADLGFLKRSTPPMLSGFKDADISVIDLFSGCGGLTVGAIEAGTRLDRSVGVALAIDSDATPLRVLRKTLRLHPARVRTEDLGVALKAVAARTSAAERAIFRAASSANGAKLLMAGPPCQGHSALNNHTRHNDPRNDLYLAVARAARLVAPDAVIIENVRGIDADRGEALTRCAAALEELGYEVVHDRLDLSQLGVPQTRVRHVLVATLGARFAWNLPQPRVRSLQWAIGDLLDIEPMSVIDTPSRVSDENVERIKWLFENDAYNLPNELRPRCHRDEAHSYISMYGRLAWDAPAQTITSGYGSIGQGRFVHPLRRRALTPHEAARLQFLPDFIRFDLVHRRTDLATMIGNVAPPALTIAIVTALIEQDFL
jgi:DNA (cytosine-5)-methyltransferase 1